MPGADASPTSFAATQRRLVGTVLVVVAVTAGVGVLGLALTARAAGTAEDRADGMAIAADDVSIGVAAAEAAMVTYAVGGDPAELDAFNAARDRATRGLDELRAAAGGRGSLPALVGAERTAAEAFLDGYARPVIASRGADPATAQARAVGGEGRRLYEQFRQTAAATAVAVEGERRDAGRRVGLTAAVSGVVLVLVASGGIVLGWRCRGPSVAAVVEPLEEVRGALLRVGDGDFSPRVAVGGPDEVAAVGQALNVAVAQMDRLTSQQRSRVEREQMIRDVSRTIREYLDVEVVLNLAARELVGAIGVDRCSVLVVEHNSLGPIVAEWVGPLARPLGTGSREQLPAGLDLVAQPLFAAGRPLVVDDTAADDRLEPEVRAAFTDLRIRALLMAPVYATDDLIALVCLQVLDRPRPWSATDVGVVESVAREMGVALSHARLFEREREMVGQLRQLDEAKNDFVSTVSHELRTPLTSIVGYVEMLRDDEAVTDAQDRMLTVIERNSDRLLALIDDLLTLSKLQSGAFELRSDPVEVAPLVEAAVQSVEPILTGRAVDLDVAVPEGVPRVAGDARQLERVLLNLLTNAVKFTPDGGRVELVVSRAQPPAASDDLVTFSVRDTGIGIPEEEQDRLFTRFFRSSSAQAAAIQGTGLGLVIVKSIVDRHHGSVSVASTPGEGTTIEFTVPVAQHWGRPHAGSGDADDEAGV